MSLELTEQEKKCLNKFFYESVLYEGNEAWRWWHSVLVFVIIGIAIFAWSILRKGFEDMDRVIRKVSIYAAFGLVWLPWRIASRNKSVAQLSFFLKLARAYPAIPIFGIFNSASETQKQFVMTERYARFIRGLGIGGVSLSLLLFLLISGIDFFRGFPVSGPFYFKGLALVFPLIFFFVFVPALLIFFDYRCPKCKKFLGFSRTGPRDPGEKCSYCGVQLKINWSW